MKKIFLSILLIAVTITLHAQEKTLDEYTIDGVKLSSVNVEYIQIVGTARFMSNKVTIQFDYGQELKLLSSKQGRLTYPTGKPVIFTGMMASMHFMIAHGYEYLDRNVITVGNQNVYHYMYRKL